MAPRNPLLPPREDLYVPTMLALKQMGGSANIEELDARVAELMQLSEDVRAVRHVSSNMSQIEYDLAWVRTFLKRAGALENSQRGVWHITPAGREMSDAELKTVYARFRGRRRQRALDGFPQDLAEDIESPISELEWRDQLLEALQAIEP